MSRQNSRKLCARPIICFLAAIGGLLPKICLPRWAAEFASPAGAACLFGAAIAPVIQINPAKSAARGWPVSCDGLSGSSSDCHSCERQRHLGLPLLQPRLRCKTSPPPARRMHRHSRCSWNRRRRNRLPIPSKMQPANPTRGMTRALKHLRAMTMAPALGWLRHKRRRLQQRSHRQCSHRQRRAKPMQSRTRLRGQSTAMTPAQPRLNPAL